MASVSLDSQTMFTRPVAADGKPISQCYVWDQNREPSIASSRASKNPQQDIYDPRYGAVGASQDDPVLISSDDESDWGDFEDGESDASFPPIEELLRTPERGGVESGSAAGAADETFYAALGTGGDSDAAEPSATGNADLDDQIASNRQPQIWGLQRSPAPPSAPAPAQPSPASPGPLQVQVEQDQPIPAGSALYKAGQAPAPEDATCGESTEEMARASPPGAESQHAPSPGRFPQPSPPRLEETTDREATPCRGSAGESDGDGDAGQLRVKPKADWTRDALRHEIRRSRDTPSVDSDETDEVEAVQLSDDPADHGSPRRRLRRRRHDSTGAGDDDMYYPPEGSEREQDEEDGDSIRPPPRKRRKIGSPIQSTLLRRSTRLQTRSGGGTSQSQQVQTSAPGRKRSGRRSIPSPPSSQGSSVQGTVRLPLADFQEWPLPNAVLKRATAKGRATFQIEFTWDSCANHSREDRTNRHLQYKLPANRRSSAKQGAPTRLAFMPEEDELLRTLKDQKLSWREIHRQFTHALPQRQRSMGGLQVRYSTKLKERQSSEGGGR